MRLLFLIGLSFFATACGNGDSYSRSYVISKSHEPPVEAEGVTSPQFE